MEFIYEAEFWVAVSFFIFIGVLVYLGVHERVTSALDARALRIGKELDEARRLREEAERLLVDYRRKLGNVVTEVDNIIALAATRSDHRLSGSFRSFDLAKSQVGPRNLADIVELLSRAGSHREALTQARCTQKACCAHAPYCG